MSAAASSSKLGQAFAEALARKDFDAIRELLHPQIDFRGMTPRRVWEANDPDQIVEEILRQWFEDSDEIREIVQIDADAFAGCERVGYRFRVANPDGEHLVEQQAYVEERDGRIGWMRVLCSGFRPLG